MAIVMSQIVWRARTARRLELLPDREAFDSRSPLPRRDVSAALP